MGPWDALRARISPFFRWPAAVAAAVLAGVALLAGRWIPLFQAPGYELSMLGCAAASLLGAPYGIAAARREIRMERPVPAAAFLAASSALLAVLALLFVVSAAEAIAASECSPFAGALFFPVLALPSALLASALGVAAGFATRGRRAAAAVLYGMVALASLAWTATDVYRGPAAFALNPLLGYWPGPIYDDALPVDGRLLFFRLATLALAAALVSATELAVRYRTIRPAGWRPALAAALGLTLSVLAWGASRSAAVRAGYAATREEVAAALGGRREGERCVIIYPEEKRPEEAERLLKDCEFDALQVARALGIDDPPRATVYVYRSEEEKRRLVGAGQTNFTKPWLSEIQITDAPLPHPVLRHELVHALAARFAKGPLRVPARLGIFVSPGLVEGLAVAVDLPHGEWTLHESARAMRDLGLMPSIERLLGPAGFFSAAPARAYTAAGSFLRYLLDRFGPARIRAVYRDGDFTRAFGEPLSALEADWSRYLDRVPVPPALLGSAESRFRPEGLLVRRCAREVAELESAAAGLVADRRGPQAARLWRRAAALSGEPGDLRAAGDAWRSAGERSCARDAYREALAAAGTGRRALRSVLEEALGDLEWQDGRPAPAAERYRAALALEPDRGQSRLLRAKLAALADPELGHAAAGWLLQAGDTAVSLARLARSPSPLAAYLAGRAFLARGAPEASRLELERAIEGRLPDRSFEFEAARALAEAECRTGAFAAGFARYERLASTAERETDRVRVRDDSERCAFEADPRRDRLHPREPGMPAAQSPAPAAQDGALGEAGN